MYIAFFRMSKMCHHDYLYKIGRGYVRTQGLVIDGTSQLKSYPLYNLTSVCLSLAHVIVHGLRVQFYHTRL